MIKLRSRIICRSSPRSRLLPQLVRSITVNKFKLLVTVRNLHNFLILYRTRIRSKSADLKSDTLELQACETLTNRPLPMCLMKRKNIVFLAKIDV